MARVIPHLRLPSALSLARTCRSMQALWVRERGAHARHRLAMWTGVDCTAPQDTQLLAVWDGAWPRPELRSFLGLLRNLCRAPVQLQPRELRFLRKLYDIEPDIVFVCPVLMARASDAFDVALLASEFDAGQQERRVRARWYWPAPTVPRKRPVFLTFLHERRHERLIESVLEALGSTRFIV